MSKRLTKAQGQQIHEVVSYVLRVHGTTEREINETLCEAEYLVKNNQSESHLPMPACKRIVAVNAMMDPELETGDAAYRRWKREVADLRKRLEQ